MAPTYAVPGLFQLLTRSVSTVFIQQFVGTVSDLNGTNINRSEFFSNAKKNGFVLLKMVTLFQNSLFDEMQFHQTSLT